MKKILLAIDGLQPSESLIQYGIETAKKSNSLLVGLFLYDLRNVQQTYNYIFYTQGSHFYYDQNKTRQEDEERIQNNMRYFSETCEKSGINFKILFNKGVSFDELIRESPFADVIIIDSKTSLFEVGENTPNHSLRSLLNESKCPVLIVPHKNQSINQVIVAYDGSESSVYALKMFSYLFPEWNGLKTTIIAVNHNASNDLPKSHDFMDLAENHFPSLNYKVLNGEIVEELENYVRQDGEYAVIVMGSYGRSAISKMLHESLSNKIIGDLKVPVFIAHM